MNNNKQKCIVIYNDEEYELKEYFNLNKKDEENDKNEN